MLPRAERQGITLVLEHLNSPDSSHPRKGNPGRGEFDETQEINYPAVMRAVVDIGSHDFVAHEFIPTWDDPVLALRHAALVCDVRSGLSSR